MPEPRAPYRVPQRRAHPNRRLTASLTSPLVASSARSHAVESVNPISLSSSSCLAHLDGAGGAAFTLRPPTYLDLTADEGAGEATGAGVTAV
eukprot:CAMPEP_0115860460 /NCGR_PEP_ID=MMETSP0287-20121206/17141_1 /TAXON_ID=412157 /ORGANISM="Chrysochromulina rotalis, Strain UIO044" /LENGTH=91 /DNA_ID=CAMNT_0003314789 /DNA_START=408 /DNA_END=680 /DNA_ORIENTATION=+